MQSCRAALRLVLLAALALPTLSGDRAAASSLAPALPLPPAVFVPPRHPRPPSVPDRRVFAQAAARTGVPLSLLLAVSYVQSHWSAHGGRPSIDGGYGLMGLVHNPERDTLDAAARLLGVPPGRVAHEDALNVLGGARLLARAARALSPHHRLPRTLGGCAAALNWLNGAASRSSAHFLVCQDGTVYQLAHVRDIAWHAGNRYINQHSIGIEHEGFRDTGGYTPAQYAASAALVRWLDAVYGLHIRLDRNAIFGHDNVPDGGHTDPGPYWDWNDYMSRVRGGAPYDGGNPSVAIVVAPEALFYDCPNPSCKVQGNADWGEQFALVRAVGAWDQVYYNGHPAWVAGAAVRAGAGARLRVGTALLPVRAAPSSRAHVMGTIARGQVYVSRLLAHAPDRDRQGWWLIAYNHRYGFINCSYAQPIGQRLPPDCAAPPAVLPRAPTPCGAAPLSATVTATAPAIEIV